jgi:hypothetical protein
MQQTTEGGRIADDLDMMTEDKPSVSFINAISEFLDTDPKDLLFELGYYNPDPQPLSV